MAVFLDFRLTVTEENCCVYSCYIHMAMVWQGKGVSRMSYSS